MAKKKKRPPVHKIAIRLLKRKKPERYIGTILELLEPGTMVPPKAIPKLNNALKLARGAVWDRVGNLIFYLEKQLKETNQGEAEKKGWVKMG